MLEEITGVEIDALSNCLYAGMNMPDYHGVIPLGQFLSREIFIVTQEFAFPPGCPAFASEMIPPWRAGWPSRPAKTIRDGWPDDCAGEADERPVLPVGGGKAVAMNQNIRKPSSTVSM